MKKYAILQVYNPASPIDSYIPFLVKYEEKIKVEITGINYELTNVYDIINNEHVTIPIYIDEHLDYLFEVKNDEEARLVFEAMKNE